MMADDRKEQDLGMKRESELGKTCARERRERQEEEEGTRMMEKKPQ